MINTPRFTTRVAMFVCVWTILATAAACAFWLYAFYINDLFQFSYADIYWQRTAGAGHFPFDTSLTQGVLGVFIMLSGVMVGSIGAVILPALTIWLALRWADYRRALPWYERNFWLLGLPTAVPTIMIVWSPLGKLVSTWIWD